ncbi:twinfilin-2-like, partial [Centruroides sculpturatus]|uniref:twinfilin-2-like n=1 Tax=Centruroides sculpturatus TaxID=218467 RepID=UPI000C6E57AF
LKLKHVDFFQSIDIDKEEINLESFEDTTIELLPSRIPNDHARYHVFRFPHNYEGDHIISIVFVYSIPGYNCPVKERMLYSSCKSQLIEIIEGKIGIEIAKRIEIDDASELTKEFLIDEIHPKKNIFRQKFAKPKGPSNRGARRLICTQTENEQT